MCSGQRGWPLSSIILANPSVGGVVSASLESALRGSGFDWDGKGG